MRKDKKTGKKVFKVMGVLLVMGLAALFPGSRLWAGVEVSFKLSGSFLGYLQDGGGDIDQVRRGIEANLTDLDQYLFYTTSFNWEKPDRASDFRVELMFKISRNFGISIGSGYLFVKNQGAYAIGYYSEENFEWYYSDYYYQDQEDCDYTRKYSVSAVPITVDTYFFLPLGKKKIFNIFAHVGAGYYFGKMEHTLGLDDTYRFLTEENGSTSHTSEGVLSGTLTERTNSRSWGYHGGLGLDIGMARFISFGAEVYGRHVEFKDWEGSQVVTGTQKGKYWSEYYGEGTVDETETDSAFGNLWTYGVDGVNENSTYTMMWVSDERPEGSWLKDVRKSSINLSSYGLSVSLKLSFNLF
jgi:hypothetical protein